MQNVGLRDEAANPTYALTMGDLHDRIFELEEEVELLEADKKRKALVLNVVQKNMEEMNSYVLKENFEFPASTFARDFAPFRNVMAHHGVEPYVKQKRAKKAV